MTRHPRAKQRLTLLYPISAFLIVLCLAGCQTGSSSGSGAIPQSVNGGFGSGGGSGLGGGGGYTPLGGDSGLNSLKDTLEGLDGGGGAGNSPGSAQAVQTLDEFVNRYQKLYGPMGENAGPQEFLSYMEILQALQQWWFLRPPLPDPPPWWPPVEEIIEELLSKKDVFQYYQPTAVRHFWTTDPNEGASVITNYQFQYAGIPFRVYPKADHENCKKPLYRCFFNDPYYIHYLHTDSSCGGGEFHGTLGYICTKQKNEAFYPLYGYYHDATGQFYYSRDTSQDAWLGSQGWRNFGIMGYPPN